jgi:hypothetical protein
MGEVAPNMYAAPEQSPKKKTTFWESIVDDLAGV